MELQVYSVVLEDRYPPGLPEGYDGEAPHLADGVRIERECDGCIAFVFGRSSDGRSACVRVEGFRPKLFFALEGSTQALRQTLEQEVRSSLVDTLGIRVERREFAHFYGYEHDPASPSGRKVHAYGEAAYPNLASWRAACKLRRQKMLAQVRERVRQTRQEMQKLSDGLLALRQGRMRGAAGADGTAMEAREAALRSEVLPGLLRREHALEEDRVDPKAIHAPDAQELMVDPTTRFLHEAGITPAAWTRVVGRTVATSVTTCDIELQADMKDFTHVERDLDAPYTTLYYDIETIGLNPSTGQLIQISLVFVTEGRRDKHLIALDTVAPLEDITVHECDDEAEVLRTFRSLVVRHDPDFLVAYNGVNFDNNFLDAVAQRVADCDEFPYLSRFALRPSRLRELALSSAGMGDNTLKYFDLAGRANFDWFVKLKRDLTSEPRYSLNHFAQKLCGLEKDDVHYTEIPRLQHGSAADRARLGHYCVQDSSLLEDLNQKRGMIVEIFQYARVFGILVEWVTFRGQQVRFIAQLLRKVRVAEAVPLLLNRPAEGFFGEGALTYEGATVNEPKRGFYTTPVATLDWASLYPAAMRAKNLCHSTHVHDPAYFAAEGVEEFRISDNFVVHFCTSARHRGILPRILEELGVQRKLAKKKMHECQSRGDHALAKVFDGRQLALKVSMNSVYGACGAVDTGKLPDLAVSATTTYIGRWAMEVKKKILPEKFEGCDIVYGDTDSVMVTFAGANTVEACFPLAAEAAAFVTNHFAETLGMAEMVLEFEKVYHPYLLEGKKRYAGLHYEPGDDNEPVCKGVKCKGLETERKDTLPLTKRTMLAVLEKLLYQMDPAAALRAFEDNMEDLIRNKVPFDEFIMKKNLSKKVEHRTDSIVQARVNDLRRQRNPGSEMAPGEQVCYVIVKGNKGEKTTLLAEDADFARENHLKLNFLWYFSHAIREPIRKLFVCFDEKAFAAACARIEARLDAQRLNVSSLKHLLVAGDAVQKPIPAPRPIAKRPKKK
jgi:DNA polymerase elongation subunit (family B)